MAVFGNIEPFSESTEDFRDYMDRMNAYMAANDIAPDKKTNLFLASIGPGTYKLLKNLCSPDKPCDKNYGDLTKLLEKHYQPEPIIIAERHRFWTARQENSESVSNYIVRLKTLASTCNFGAFLAEALRDKLVSGLNQSMTRVQRQLLSTKNLTFEDARMKCIADELASQPNTCSNNASAAVGPTVDTHRVQDRHDNRRGQGSHSTTRTRTNFSNSKRPCSRCVGTDHDRENCVHKEATCFNCQKKGHLQRVCRSKKQDVDISPLPYVNFRTIGGILDFYFFLGPTPEDVVSQYTEAIGRPFMPPYWSLGFQLSRYGYNNLHTLQDTVDRMRSFDIPFDVQYGDIDYMDNERDFTYDEENFAGLPNYVNTLHEDYKMKYIIILDPCIAIEFDGYAAYEEGMAENIWVMIDGNPAPAEVWPPGVCYFPDYFLSATQDWWTKQCTDFHKIIDYDGLWIDMNEPANFVHGTPNGCNYNNLNYPPYKPRTHGDVLAQKTTCNDATQGYGYYRHYDVHNIYGLSQAIQTVPAMRSAIGGNKRGIAISRSTFPGIGQYAGHWLGDNFSVWSNLAYSIIGCLEFNMFGIPYIGADICGFNYDTTEELCQRWMQVGAFYTFSRNHNGLNWREQDPAVFGPEFAEMSKKTLVIRYSLLPYLYTLFYHSHTSGSTVMRPLFHEFYEDENTMTIDRQFLWGPAFMISPVLEQGAETVNAYFPKAMWYDYYTGMRMSASGSSIVLPAQLDVIPLHIRSGYILPTQEPDVTTYYSRQNPMGLIVALDFYGRASGDLFYDDGDTVDTIENNHYYYAEFIANERSLTSDVIVNGYTDAASLIWGNITVFGVSSSSSVTVNGCIPEEYKHNPFTEVLIIIFKTCGITIDEPLSVYW